VKIDYDWILRELLKTGAEDDVGTSVFFFFLAEGETSLGFSCCTVRFEVEAGVVGAVEDGESFKASVIDLC